MTMPTDPNTQHAAPRVSKSTKTVVFLSIVVVMAALALAVTALLVNIFERKQEARYPFVRIVEVDNNTTDPAIWGTNWPREYDSYTRTVDITRTKYGGSDGPIPASRIEKDPWLKRMFAGYAFGIDFRERRGHAYMLYDQENTRRVLDRPQAGACLHCHASIVPTYRRVGLEMQGKLLADANGFDWPAVVAGFRKMSTMPYTVAHGELLKTPDGSGIGPVAPTTTQAAASTTQQAIAQQVGRAHPVSCVDCHDPQSMQLRVTRPAFAFGIAALAKSDDPVPHLPSVERWRKGRRQGDYDANRDASRQEMRTFVCAQCHVEYYCAPKTVMFYPWNNGLKVEQIESYYNDYKFPDNTPFMDFKHAETGAPIFKAQHPEFEMWSQGVHARSGVACADCHMPYKREGAMKVTEHWVRSPLLMINHSCQSCHNFPEAEMLARVTAIQERNDAQMSRAGKAINDLLDAIKAAKASGADESQLKQALKQQRKAQWRLDFVNAENSMGFHAPQEAMRILGEAIDYARQGQIAAIAAQKAPATQPAKR